MSVFEHEESGVENRLLLLEENYVTPSGENCVVEVTVGETGSWFVKFRDTGVIFNKRDLVFADSVHPDAKLTFVNYETFSDFASGKCTLEELQKQLRLTVWQRDTEFTVGLGRMFRVLLDREDAMLTPTKKRSRRHSAMALDGPVIKSGWFYKKRDIIMGWRCRYFVVYPGRVEYFRDEHDVIPRGVIPLLGAEIKGPKKCTVNGNEDHSSLIIEPKHKDKVYKLASNRSGEDGNSDALSWIQALVQATKPVDSAAAQADAAGNVPTSVTPQASSLAQPRRVRRLLGSVIAAVQHRTVGGGSSATNSPNPPATVSRVAAQGSPAPSTVARIAETASTLRSIASPLPGASNSRVSQSLGEATAVGTDVVPEKVEADSEIDKNVDLWIRITLMIVSLAIVGAGWYWNGHYGTITAVSVCVMTIIIAFAPV